MTAALTTDQRSRLDKLVARTRKLLEDDLASEAAGRFGIDREGTIAAESDLRLDPASLAARRELVEVLEHLRGEGLSAAGAVERLLREAVFTHLNRLVAIRIAEAIGLLPPSLADGRQSQGFRDILEIVPLLATDGADGYWIYLQLCADELSVDVPALFDARNPLLDLVPSLRAFDEVVDALSDPGSADLWSAADALGWTYQFFNRKEERDVMRESSAPRTSRELAVRNQFFTPRYVVDFLVHNTLGRRLVEADPNGGLVTELDLLLDPPTEQGAPLELSEVEVLDPAVGSGHFLLGAYDVLERAWALAGVQPEDSAPHIVRSLWGIDIDARAVQVAAAAVMFRARRHCRDKALPRPNIFTARALPEIDHQASAPADLTSDQRRTLASVATAMSRAPQLGSLLKVEEELQSELRHAGLGRDRVGELEVTEEALTEAEAGLLSALGDAADAATATAAERLFAAEAGDALGFINALRRRYDAVLMNPPFGEPIPDTKSYLRTAYRWAPARVDLLALFVGRGIELCRDAGYVGAITNRAGLFLTSFRKWREDVLFANRLVALADLGYRVMAQAKVEAAAYVVGRGRAADGEEASFIRLLRDADRAAALPEVISHARAGDADARIFRVALKELRAIPGSPIAYAMSPAIRRLFADLPRIEAGADVRQGLATGDDGRFVRAFWEVDPRRIARSAEETEQRRWAPLAKGGTYACYWSDIHLLVDYANRGQTLRDFSGAVVRNPQCYFKPGLTWPRRTNSALSVRVLPAGCVFADKGPAVVGGPSLELLAWLNSRYVRFLIDTTAAGADEDKTDVSRSYEVGTLQDLPDPTALPELDHGRLSALAQEAAEKVALSDEADETSRRFVAPAALLVQGESLRERAATAARDALERASDVIRAHDDADRLFGCVLDPEGAAEEALHSADGPLVSGLADGRADPDLLLRPVGDVVAAATERIGIARWIGLQHQVADRRLELAAIAEKQSPAALLEGLPPESLPAEEPKRTADDLVSYLVGVALGRWDVRIAKSPSSASPRADLFDPVPLCPPGALVESDGIFATEAPSSYPLEIPPDRILLDEPGNRWDIETRLTAGAKALFDDADAVVAELLRILGRPTLRDHLRRRFFKDHLPRYSKSRRKAPIYWPLYVPSGQWGLWLYAPMLSREMLFAAAGAAAARLAGAEAEIRRLQRERSTGGAGRSEREVAGALAAEEALAEELRLFHAEAERVARLGWEPNLDDGIILCAAPLAELFPAWRDAAAARDEIKTGKYDWATVSEWAEQL